MRPTLLAQTPGADFQQNHFQLFGLPQRYRIDSALFERQFHALQAQVHPDNFTHMPEAERRVSMQWATRVNEAYQTLRNPLSRARYLLALHGVDTQEETNTAMPADFLMKQIEWREAVEEARRAAGLNQLSRMEIRLRQEMTALREQLAVTIDDVCNYALAAEIVRKLKFMEKLAEDIASALDEQEETFVSPRGRGAGG